MVDTNNPLGVCYTREEIKAFCDIARNVNAYFLHDCTYRDFADEHTLAARFYPERAITIYSFSKWLGLAGLRVGAVVANRQIIEELAAYSTATLGASVLAQRTAQAGLAVKSEWMPAVQRIQRAPQSDGDQTSGGPDLRANGSGLSVARQITSSSNAPNSVCAPKR